MPTPSLRQHDHHHEGRHQRDVVGVRSEGVRAPHARVLDRGGRLPGDGGVQLGAHRHRRREMQQPRAGLRRPQGTSDRTAPYVPNAQVFGGSPRRVLGRSNSNSKVFELETSKRVPARELRPRSIASRL
eukprot:1077509-Prorocentrum_minimum.AAC.8